MNAVMQLWRVVLLGVGLGCSACAIADIYILDEEDGSIALSNIPDDSRYQLLLHVSQDDAAAITGSTAPAAQPQPARAMPFGSMVEAAARANDVEAALLHAVIRTESGHNPRAVSKKGATGLMQLMPETARRYGVADSYDPAENMRGGARYLKDLLKQFNNDVRLSLAAYNAGEHAVTRHGNRIPPYRETVKYVDRVMKLYDQYRISNMQEY